MVLNASRTGEDLVVVEMSSKPQLTRRGLRTLTSLLGLLLATLAFGAPALADTPRTYVTGFVGLDNQADTLVVEQIARATRERLAADSSLQLARPIAAAGDSAKSGATSPAMIEASRLYESARAQYVDQRYAEAAANYAQAFAFMEANVVDITDWQTVRTLLFRLAAARYQIGQTAEAEDAARRLLALAPGYALPSDDDTLTPEFVSSFEALRTDITQRSEGSLDSSAVESGAEIWIDGDVRGVTPMTVDKLTPGRHFVVLKKGEQRVGLVVAIEPGAATTLQASLENRTPDDALREAIADGKLGDDARLAARDLANRAATSHIVTALVVPLEGRAGYAVQAYVYHEELAQLRALTPVVFDADLLKLNVEAYNLARAIAAAVNDPAAGTGIEGELAVNAATLAAAANVSTSSATVTLRDPVTDTPREPDTALGGSTTAPSTTGSSGGNIITGVPDEEAWYENPWLWTGVGLGLVAIGGTVAAIVLTTGDSGQPQVTGFNATIAW